MRCDICGKETSAGEGYETALGFVCMSCYNARNFQICAECGRRFPRDEMIEWNDMFYCRSDYFTVKERYERIREEERKKKEEEERKRQPPPVKPSSGLGVQIHKKKKLVGEEIRSLIGEINKTKFTKMEREETKRQEELEKEEGEKTEKIKETEKIEEREGIQERERTQETVYEENGEEKETIHSLLSQISSFADVTVSQVGDISLSKTAKEKRKDVLSDVLNELNSLLRQKVQKK